MATKAKKTMVIDAAATTVEWFEVAPVATVGKQLLAAHKAAAEQAKLARQQLEAYVVAGLNSKGMVKTGQKVVFAYRYGPSFAIVADDGSGKKETKKSVPDFGF